MRKVIPWHHQLAHLLISHALDLALPPPVSAGAERPLYMVREVIPWHHQFMVLFRRSCKEQWRRRSMLVTSMVQTLVMAVLIGTTWLMIGEPLLVDLGLSSTRGPGEGAACWSRPWCRHCSWLC